MEGVVSREGAWRTETNDAENLWVLLMHTPPASTNPPKCRGGQTILFSSGFQVFPDLGAVRFSRLSLLACPLRLYRPWQQN